MALPNQGPRVGGTGSTLRRLFQYGAYPLYDAQSIQDFLDRTNTLLGLGWYALREIAVNDALVVVWAKDIES